MSFDISPLFEQWDYQPGKLQVRKFTGKDGQEKLQLRIDLGIMQMNASGRPDGKRPYGHATLLEHFQALKERTGDAFKLSAEDCARLQQEVVQFHHRYICLFQIGDFEGVIRDTERNLKAMEFAAEHAAGSEFAEPLRQFLPQLLMLQTRARGTLALEDGRVSEAEQAIEGGLEALRTFWREQGQMDNAMHSGEILSLEAWLEEVRQRKGNANAPAPEAPGSEREKLERALSEAIAREDYEKAAQVRDALRNLG